MGYRTGKQEHRALDLEQRIARLEWKVLVATIVGILNGLAIIIVAFTR